MTPSQDGKGSDLGASDDVTLMLAGIIGAARGLRGEAFVEPRTDRVEEVFSPGSVLFLETEDGVDGELVVDFARTHNGRLFVAFEGVETREEIEKLRGLHLLTEAESENDAWYAHELVDLPVFHVDGTRLGVVSGLAAGAAQDLLLVSHGGREVMVPMVQELVPKISVEERIVVVDPPAGLFDEADGEQDVEDGE